MSVDKYLTREYNSRTYNCAHLVCEVWKDLKGEELSNVLQGFLCPREARQASLSLRRQLSFLIEPESPCIVLMQTPRSTPHVGIWLRGRVLHIASSKGVKYQPLELASIGFKKVRFLTCNK